MPQNTPIHVPDRAILEVFYSTGIRRQELADLELSDVDPEGGLLRGQCGNGGKGRMVPLGKEASEAVAKYVAYARPVLLGRKEDAGILFLSKSGLALQGIP